MTNLTTHTMKFTDAQKTAAATIAAGILAQPKQHRGTKNEEQIDFLEEGDLIEDENGTWLAGLVHTAKEWHRVAFYSPKGADGDDGYKRMRLVMSYEERVARHALRTVLMIERVALFVEQETED